MSASLTIDDPRYFDRLALAEEAHWWSAGMWRLAGFWLDPFLKGRRGLLALDVGCGSGGILRRLALRPEIAGVVGIDPAPAALRHSGDGAARGSAERLPFLSGAFDLVVCLDVMQHLGDGLDLIASREIARVLRPGGLALVRANGRGLWPNPHADRPPYRLAELVALLRDGGLKPVRASYANGLPSVASELVGRCLPKRARAEGLGHPSGGGLQMRARPGWWNAVMAGISGAEALAVGRFGVRLPVGHSTMALAVRGEEGGR